MLTNTLGRSERQDQPFTNPGASMQRSSIIQMVQANQGTDGLHPETGKAKFNPYKIPPDLEISEEFYVGKSCLSRQLNIFDML